jgi:UDP-glucose 4-epimerase
MEKVIVTGCAGFIASNLTDRLLSMGYQVTGIDNFSTGQRRFLETASSNPRFELIEGDLLDRDLLKKVFAGHQAVFHFAANADVRFGTNHPEKDLQQNTIATFNVLEAMRLNGIKKLAFSSTSAVYGEPKLVPTPENTAFPVQTSLYGASKAACEGMIQAYGEGFGFQSWIFRFVSIMGERYTHGHVYDFYKKLLQNPKELLILGNGLQKKSYLYVQDCLDAIFFSMEKFKDTVNVVNLGRPDYCQVNDSVAWITGHLGLTPALKYSGGERGWIGDNPFAFLDVQKLLDAGWQPKVGLKESIIKTLAYLEKNRWAMETRENL